MQKSPHDHRGHSCSGILHMPFVVIKAKDTEGPEKATKGGGLNVSQLKFLTGTWPIS
jgi:hypothetical protein